MFIINVHNRTTGTRQRQVTDWRIIQHADGTHSVRGIVVSGNEIGDGKIARITTTSSIKSRKGRVMVTASGSEYTLLEPHPDQEPDAYMAFPEL